MYDVDRIYVYKDCMYDTLPEGMYVHKRVMRNEIEYNYLKKESYIVHIMLTLLCLVVLWQYFRCEPVTIQLNIPKQLYVKDNILQYNIFNPVENTENIIVRLTYINEDVVSAINLQPGDELSNISCTYFNVAGDYDCMLTYEIEKGMKSKTFSRAVKVLVE